MTTRRFLVCFLVLTTLLAQYGCRTSKDEQPAPATAEEYVRFEGPAYDFPYPAGWSRMDDNETAKLVEMNVAPLGIRESDIVWAGGVYTGCLDPSDCSNGANVFAVAMHMAGFPGPMSDVEFSRLAESMEATYKSSLGSRLYAFDVMTVSSSNAIAVAALGMSRKQVIRSVSIYAKTDYAYMVFCGASQSQYDRFAEVFDEVIEGMVVHTD